MTSRAPECRARATKLLPPDPFVHSMPGKKFDDSHADHLDRPDRGKDIDWNYLFSELGLSEGQTLADIGAGTGFYSVPFARAIGGPGGGDGKVYAVDISETMLARIRAKMEKEGISNINPVLSSENSIPVADECCDIAFMASVFHELNGDGTLNEARRILKTGGKLAVIDWKKVEEETGPPVQHRMDPEEVVGICTGHGFKFSRDFDAGKSFYGLIFVKI